MTPKELNGINVDQLVNTIEDIKKKPDIAKFKFRATNQWLGGTHNRATVKDFYGAARRMLPDNPWFLTWMNPRFSVGTTKGLIRWNICW
jgi:hypothetical protein